MSSTDTKQLNLYTITSEGSGHSYGVFPGATAEDALEAWYRDAGVDHAAALADDPDVDDRLLVEPVEWVELDPEDAADRFEATAAAVAELGDDDYLLAAVDAATGGTYYQVVYCDVDVKDRAPTLDAARDRAMAILSAYVARLA